MASAILTSPVEDDGVDDWAAMPAQALTAILNGSIYQLSYTPAFSKLAPSLASAIVAGTTPLQMGSTGVVNKLGTVNNVNMNFAGVTTLYTCPAGFKAIIYRVVLRDASVSLTTVSISLGWNSATFNDVIANATHTELTGNTVETSLLPKVGAAIGTAAGTFKVIVNTPQGVPALLSFDVFGFLVPA